jgi:DNA-binding NtrC family response regulator
MFPRPIRVHRQHLGLRPKSGAGRTHAKKPRPKDEGVSSGNTGRRILSVSYDQSLLLTREMLLTVAGFEATSVKTLRDALECCRNGRFDLIIVGHSIPKEDKQDIVQQLRKLSSAPVLSIRRHGEEPLPDATHSVDSIEGPTGLLEAVERALHE